MVLWFSINHFLTSFSLGFFFHLIFSCSNSSIGYLVKHPLSSEWVTFDLGTKGKLLVVRELPRRLLTVETFGQSDEETWPDQQKGNNKVNDKDITSVSKSQDYCWHWNTNYISGTWCLRITISTFIVILVTYIYKYRKVEPLFSYRAGNQVE